MIHERSAKLDNLVNRASEVFGNKNLYQNYRIPTLFNWGSQPNPENKKYKSVSALWTADGFRPRWDNLAVLTDFLESENEIKYWKKLLQELNIKFVLLASSNQFKLLSNKTPDVITFNENQLVKELERCRAEAFSPRALAELKVGQLTFADIEESITKNSFSYLARQKGELDKALRSALIEAQESEKQERLKKFQATELNIDQQSEIYESILSVSTAFLAARILEDKGFFGKDHIPTNDPEKLLKQTVTKQNGFFKMALETDLPKLSQKTQQYLAKNLGASISFSLVDHRDVGRLYEQASLVWEKEYENLEQIADTPLFSQKPLINLQRHYTPFSIADRMLKALPLERIRPEDRTIIDLAAGSGTLLLTSTLRLAAMPDIPQGKERIEYLHKHVIGNDIDKLASLVTKLRYLLIDQSVGSQETTLLPMPEFHVGDYNEFNPKLLSGDLKTPKVWVANPPFSEQGKQRAFEFVEMVSGWMKKGDQFAFVLPQSFLSGVTHRAPEARNTLMKNSLIHEVWQLPERYVGISAQQQVCIISGTYGANNNSVGTISRSIISRRKTAELRDAGFLGASWLSDSSLNSNDLGAIVHKQNTPNAETIPLEKLFFVFNGVNLNKNYPPVSEEIPGIPCKEFWRTRWLQPGRIWANPNDVKSNEKYVRYDEQHMNATRYKNEHLFDLPKIIVARARNRDTKDILAAHFDTTGFCINNAAYAISLRSNAELSVKNNLVPDGWNELKDEDKFYWLLGILTSTVVHQFLIGKKVGVNLPSTALEQLPLPMKIDFEIIKIVDEMLKRDQFEQPIPKNDLLRSNLNEIVAASYGISSIDLPQNNLEDMLNEWKAEQNSEWKIVTGQVLEKDINNNKIKIYLTGILDDNEEAWISLPFNIPGWTLEGNIFTAEVSEDIKTFADISSRPWAMRNFKHSPRPYLTVEELKAKFSAFIN